MNFFFLSYAIVVALPFFSLVACSAAVGEFQEDLPDGGKAIIQYEVNGNEITKIVQSFESTKYLLENRYIFHLGELSSVQSVVSEILYNDDFAIIGSKEIASRTWDVGEAGLVLRRGNMNNNPLGNDPDYLLEAKRLKKLVVKKFSSATGK